MKARYVELDVIVDELEYRCRRDGRCVLRLVLDPAKAAALAEQLGRDCFLEDLVEVEVTVEDFVYDCRRNVGCLVRMELSEREAERLRSYLASLCL
jgi:hypothetical protein